MLVRARKYVMREPLAKRMKHRAAPKRLSCKPSLKSADDGTQLDRRTSSVAATPTTK